MNVLMYVCPYVCKYLCKYVCICVCTYLSMYVCLHVHIYIHVFMYVCMHVCTYACTYIRMYVRMHVCIPSLPQLTLVHQHELDQAVLLDAEDVGAVAEGVRADLALGGGVAEVPLDVHAFGLRERRHAGESQADVVDLREVHAVASLDCGGGGGGGGRG